MARILYTAFPIKKDNPIENFVKTVSNWIASSSYKGIPRKELEGIGNDNFKLEKEHITINTVRYEDLESKIMLYGVRLIERSNPIKQSVAIRTTDIVGNKSNESFYVSLSHDYETNKAGDVCNDLPIPRIIRETIQNLGGGLDGTILSAKIKPHLIKEEELKTIAKVIRNETENKLPIVYLSKNALGKTLVKDQNRLAFTLAGLAHVLVEPSVNFSYKLKHLTQSRNTFGGAVGIHWPNGLRKFILLNTEVKKIEDELCEIIRKHSLYVLVPENLGFNGIRSIQAQKKLGKLSEEYNASKKQSEEERIKMTGQLEQEQKNIKDKDAHIKSLTQIIEGKDKNITYLNKTIEEKVAENKYMNEVLEVGDVERNAQKETIGRISEQNRNLNQRVVSLSNKRLEPGNLIIDPRVSNLYDGETGDKIIYALEYCLANGVYKDSRGADIIREILRINQSTGKKEDIQKKIKSAFAGKNGKHCEQLVNTLGKLGLLVIKKDNHMKIFVPGSERQVFTGVPPSDIYVGDKVCAEINRILF